MPLLGRQSPPQAYRSSLPDKVAPAAVAKARRSLVASGERIGQKDGEKLRRIAQTWQQRSFGYYDLLGEIKYAAQFYSRMLTPLRLYAAEMDDDGQIVETKNPDAIAALERIRDPGGGRRQLLAQYGRLMFLTGEAYLFVSEDKDTKLEQWEMLSANELRVDVSNRLVRVRAPGLAQEEYQYAPDDDWEPIAADEQGVAYRLWRRHPNYSSLADATMQGVLDLCEELLLLTQAVRSRARSRLAGAGILVIDDRLIPKILSTKPEEDTEEDPFISDLVEAITAPISDEGSASAYVPLVLRVTVPDGMTAQDMIYHLQINDPTQLYPETGLRRECIDRIAIGLDMPPEVLTGTADVNHWGAWQIDEQTWKGHGQPIAQQLVDDLSSSYYRPYLRDQHVPGWERFVIGYDAADIINHPDRSKDAKDLYDRRAIGKAPLRIATGFTDGDAPTEEERAEMVGVAVHDGSLAWYGEPSVKAGGVEVAPGDIVNPNEPPQTGPSTGGEVEPGPPNAEVTPADVVASTRGNGLALKAARVLGAADLALMRAREAAGNRIKSRAKKNPDVLAEIRGVRSSQIAAKLGRDKVRALGFSQEAELLIGTSALMVDALVVLGVIPEVAERVSKELEQHAARTLYEETPSPLPATFQNYVQGILAKA